VFQKNLDFTTVIYTHRSIRLSQYIKRSVEIVYCQIFPGQFPAFLYGPSQVPELLSTDGVALLDIFKTRCIELITDPLVPRSNHKRACRWASNGGICIGYSVNIFPPLAKQFIEKVREDVCILADIDQFRVRERRSSSSLLLPAQRHSPDAVSLRAPT
jgi:hypothetical protein